MLDAEVGCQSPRYLFLPPGGDDSFGNKAVLLAELAGLHLDPWQQLALKSMLARHDDQWAAFESCLLVPRQNGKSVVLEAFDLAKLFLSPPGHLILHTAHLFPTAVESWRHLVGCIRNTPDLYAEVDKIPKARGDEGIELKNGSRLKFTARGVSGAGRGFSPDDVVLDEAYRLPHEALSALLPALSAKPDPQIVYTSSAGYPDSEILWSLVTRGRRGDDPTLAYLEWSADPSLDLADESQWWEAARQSNPALGYRLSRRKILAEWMSQRREDFERERLGLWAESQNAPVLPNWGSCEDTNSQIVDVPVFAPAVSTDRLSASIGVCGARDDGLEHLELVQNGPGTGWIVPTLAQYTSKHGGSVVIDPSSPAGSLLDDLKAAGVRVHTVGARDYAQACGWVFDAVANKEIRHLGQPELAAAVAGTRLRTLAGGFAWDLREPLADVTPLVAVTLACWGHRTFGGNLADSVW